MRKKIHYIESTIGEELTGWEERKRDKKMQKRQNKEFFLTPNQYERVVKIAKEFKKSTDEMVDEIEYWFIGYGSIDKILNDLEDPTKAISAIYRLEATL